VSKISNAATYIICAKKRPAFAGKLMLNSGIMTINCCAWIIVSSWLRGARKRNPRARAETTTTCAVLAVPSKSSCTVYSVSPSWGGISLVIVRSSSSITIPFTPKNIRGSMKVTLSHSLSKLEEMYLASSK